MTTDRGLRAITVSFAILAVAFAASCSGGADPAPAPTSGGPAVIDRPASTAELEVVSPRDGAVVPAGAVPLRISLDGAELVPTASADLRPDEGHLHVLLDDELLDMTSELRGTLPDVEPGSHLLRVEFVASDHAPFDPRVVADVVFEAKA